MVPARPTGQIQALLVTTTHLCEVVGAFRVGGTGHKGKGEGTCPPDGCAVTGRDLPVVLFRSFAEAVCDLLQGVRFKIEGPRGGVEDVGFKV